MTRADALRALADSQARVTALETERQRLALRVTDLEQQLAGRAGAGQPTVPDPSLLSLFHELAELPETVVAPAPLPRRRASTCSPVRG
jgi:hypothetical protein